MKRKTKIIILTAVSAAAVLIVLFMAFSYKENHYHVCSACYTRRFKDKWWVGYCAGPRLTIWSRQVIQETNIYNTLFTPDHPHTWAFAHSYCVNIFPFFHTYGRYASGRGAHMNDFTAAYEYIPQFRDFVNTEIEQAKLTQDQIRQILRLPVDVLEYPYSPATDSELAKKARTILDGFSKTQRPKE